MKQVQGLTTLENAAREGDLFKVKRLLRRKLVRKARSAAHKKGHSGWTLLHHAALHGHREIVLYLVEKYKVEVNATNDFGDTAIYYASRSGHVDTVRYLHSMGADAQRSNLRRSTPLHVAAVQGHLEVVMFLVQAAQANVHVKDVMGTTALHGACYRGHLEVARYLIESCRASVNSQNKAGNTPLHLACTSNQLDMVIYLVESCCANVNAKNASGLTPLHLAAHQGFLQMVQFLVVRGKAEVNKPAPVDGTTALDVAKMSGHADIVQFLQQYAVPNRIFLTDDVDAMTRLTEPYDYIDTTGYAGEEEKVEDTYEIPAVLEFYDVVEPVEPANVAPWVSEEFFPTRSGRPSLVEERDGLDNDFSGIQRVLVEPRDHFEGLLQRVASLEAHLLAGPAVGADSNIATRLERLESATGIHGRSNRASLPEMPPTEREAITAIVGDINDDDDSMAACYVKS